MRRRKKKSPFNWAVCLMVITTVCLCSIQYGYSFFNQSFMFGGTGHIQNGSTNSAFELVSQTNQGILIDDFSQDPTSDAENLGYSSIMRGDNTTSAVNNYIKFSENATELWRIVGWTEDGIKVVHSQDVNTEKVLWDAAAAHWVALDEEQTLPHTQLVTSLDGASQICTYLNTTYYDQLTNISNVNYVNPNYINHQATWDITPMEIDSNQPYYVTGTESGSILVRGVVSSTFNGLPIGLLSVTEMNILSNTFTSSNENLYSSAIDGWFNTDVEVMTITERARDDEISTTSYSSTQAIFLQNHRFRNSAKSSDRAIKPAMVIFSDVILTTSNSGSGVAGSSTNPFIVVGRGAA